MTSNFSSRLGHRLIRSGVTARVPGAVKSFEQKAQLAELIKKHRIDCIFDVGANRGWFSASLREFGFEGDIFSFEPIRADHDRIAEMAAGDEKWKTFPFALGDKEETKDFTIIESSGGQTVLSSFLGADAGIGKSSKTEQMEIKTIDGVFADLPFSSANPRIFLKTDTQGYDINVVRGAEKTLQHVRLLQSELAVGHLYPEAPHYTEALEVFESYGFKLIDLHVIGREPSGAVLEFDCVMAKPE